MGLTIVEVKVDFALFGKNGKGSVFDNSKALRVIIFRQGDRAGVAQVNIPCAFSQRDMGMSKEENISFL